MQVHQKTFREFLVRADVDNIEPETRAGSYLCWISFTSEFDAWMLKVRTFQLPFCGMVCSLISKRSEFSPSQGLVATENGLICVISWILDVYLEYGYRDMVDLH